MLVTWRACLWRDRSHALVEPEEPGGAPALRQSLPGAWTRDHQSHSGSLLHFSQRHLKTTLQQYTVDKVQKTVHGPPLCLHREWCLHHSPTVVAGSSMDRICTGTKGTASGVLRTTGADRTTKEGKASGRSDRHCHLPSRLRNSGRASTRTPGILVPVNCNTRSRKRQYVDAGPPCQRRTRWLAGPASVTSHEQPREETVEVAGTDPPCWRPARQLAGSGMPWYANR